MTNMRPINEAIVDLNESIDYGGSVLIDRFNTSLRKKYGTDVASIIVDCIEISPEIQKGVSGEDHVYQRHPEHAKVQSHCSGFL